MKNEKEFPFESAKRVTEKEVREARRAVEQKLGTKRKSRGRPPKNGDKYLPISIRLHPKAAAWARKEAERRGVGYQTVINEVLLKKAS